LGPGGVRVVEFSEAAAAIEGLSSTIRIKTPLPVAVLLMPLFIPHQQYANTGGLKDHQQLTIGLPREKWRALR
jgi:hypothetical protein